MPACFVPMCNSGYNSCKEKRHFFRVKDNNVKEWSRLIPRKDKLLTSKCFVCDLHFENKYFITTYKHLIKGETVEIPRGKWELSADAKPTIFPKLPSYLTKKITPKRGSPSKRKLNQSFVKIEKVTITSQDCLLETEGNDEIGPIVDNATEEVILDNNSNAKVCVSVKKGNTMVSLQEDVYNLTKKLKASYRKIKKLSNENKKLKVAIKKKNLLNMINELKINSRQKLIIKHMLQSFSCKSPSAMRYDTEWILDSLLLKIRSTSNYNFLRTNGYLPLPSPSICC